MCHALNKSRALFEASVKPFEVHSTDVFTDVIQITFVKACTHKTLLFYMSRLYVIL